MGDLVLFDAKAEAAAVGTRMPATLAVFPAPGPASVGVPLSLLPPQSPFGLESSQMLCSDYLDFVFCPWLSELCLFLDVSTASALAGRVSSAALVFFSFGSGDPVSELPLGSTERGTQTRDRAVLAVLFQCVPFYPEH